MSNVIDDPALLESAVVELLAERREEIEFPSEMIEDFRFAAMIAEKPNQHRKRLTARPGKIEDSRIITTVITLEDE